jgi:hypothetical protein
VLVFEVPNTIRIFYEKENELIIHEWFEYNPENVRDDIILENLQKIYDIFLTYPVEKVIVKADQTKGAFSPGVLEYIKTVQFPRVLADTEIRYVVTIQSKEEMNQMPTFIWQEHLKKGSRAILHDVGTEKEARTWLKTIDSI